MLEVIAKTKKKQRNFRRIVVTAIAGISLVSVAMPIVQADTSQGTSMTNVSPRTAQANIFVSSTAKNGVNGLQVRLENRTSGASTAWAIRDQKTNIPAEVSTRTTTISIKSKDVVRRHAGYRRQGQTQWIHYSAVDSTVS